MIPYSTQTISKKDINGVVKILKSLFLTQGSTVPEFEEKLCSLTSSKFAICTNSATSSLHIACLALGLKKNDWLWTSPISFVASANCGLYCGASIDFVDIDKSTFNICPSKLEEKLIIAKKRNVLPKIVIPVHMTGKSCNMEAIFELSKKYNFKIIEDASHAVGGKYKGKYIGSCQYSDVTVFSFHPVKIITTAEGGASLTNNKKISERMRSLREHGVVKKPDLFQKNSHGRWYYEQQYLGFNYRMTDIHASLGITQLKNLKKFVKKRQEIVKRYNKSFKNFKGLLPSYDVESSYHLYILRFPQSLFKAEKKSIFEFLRNKGIGVNVHYIPIHLQPYYHKLGFKKGDFPNAEKFYSEAISIPIFPKLTIKEQNFIIKQILKIT